MGEDNPIILRLGGHFDHLFVDTTPSFAESLRKSCTEDFSMAILTFLLRIVSLKVSCAMKMAIAQKF
jgi:hypothetical protein